MHAWFGIAVSRRPVFRTAIGLLVYSAGWRLLPGPAAAQPSRAANACVVIGYDKERVAVVLQALKQAAQSMTPDPIEPYLEYPFIARSPAGNIVIKSAKDLRRAFRRIFTDRVKAAILSQNLEDAFSNYQGVMVGDGEVWITEVCRERDCRDSKYIIRAINF
jgi:hypothetical protein